MAAIDSKRMDVVVVGGSVSGLIAGILLKRQGHAVTVLEQATSSAREGMAAGLGLDNEIKQFFDENDKLPHIPFTIQMDGAVIIDTNTLLPKRKLPYASKMTTWDSLYHRLRANFDGFASAYNPNPPDLSDDLGTATYLTSRKVLDIKEIPGSRRVIVTAQDIENSTDGPIERYEADLIIGADGSFSKVRQIFNTPATVERHGYILWRGAVPISQVSQNLRDKLENRTTIYPLPSGTYAYSVIYTIPGTAGALGPNETKLNWAIYCWPWSQAAVPDILTDTDGKTHRTTLPKGKMRPEIWAKQKLWAKSVFAPDMHELFDKAETPFVSVIGSVITHKATFLDNRVILVGDAFMQPQPNTARGANSAARSIMRLCDIIKRGQDPAEIAAWEADMKVVLERERLRSIFFASLFLRGLYGKMVAGFRVGWCYVTTSISSRTRNLFAPTPAKVKAA